MDFSFLDNEDFGLAKSFSTAPILSIAPHIPLAAKAQEDVEHALEQDGNAGEFVTEGFCFKLAPGNNVRLTKFFYLTLAS